MTKNQNDDYNDIEKTHKIESLREMIVNAEKTIQGAKAMLLQLEGKKKTGRKRKVETEEEGSIVEGTFDGQIMIGIDGKQYPVPANYASKSKLVEGDMLKLTITPDGSFVYKQIGPIERRHAIGVAGQDERGNYYIFVEGKAYKILLASITYFKIEPGDEVAVVLPRDIEGTWAAVDNVLQKSKGLHNSVVEHHHNGQPPSNPTSPMMYDWKNDLKEISSNNNAKSATDTVLDEWTSDIDDLEKEIQ